MAWCMVHGAWGMRHVAVASFSFCQCVFLFSFCFGFCPFSPCSSCVCKIHSPSHFGFVGRLDWLAWLAWSSERRCCGAVGLASFIPLNSFPPGVNWFKCVSVHRPQTFWLCYCSIIFIGIFIHIHLYLYVCYVYIPYCICNSLGGHGFYWHVELTSDLGYWLYKKVNCFRTCQKYLCLSLNIANSKTAKIDKRN